MNIIAIHKAQGIDLRPETDVEPAEVRFHDTFPVTDTLSQSRELAALEGEILARLLRDTLPGSTFDYLCAELLRMRASQLVVPHRKDGAP